MIYYIIREITKDGKSKIFMLMGEPQWTCVVLHRVKGFQDAQRLLELERKRYE